MVMDLPEEIFKELTIGASFAPQPSGSELRAAPRLRPAPLAVILIRLNGDKNAKPMQATIIDLSTHGVGLQFSEPIHVNDPFAIRLPRRTGKPVWIQCASVRWSPIDGKTCNIGARFTGLFAPPKSGEPEPPIP
jgi:hypothetical protein